MVLTLAQGEGDGAYVWAFALLAAISALTLITTARLRVDSRT